MFRGRERMQRYYADWLALFDEHESNVESVLCEEGDVAAVIIVTRARPRGTSAWARGRYAVVYTVRDGLVVRGREYPSADAARRRRGRPGLAGRLVGPAGLAAQARARRQPGGHVDARHRRQDEARRHRARVGDAHVGVAACGDVSPNAQTGWSPPGAEIVTRIRDPARYTWPW